MFDWQNRQKNLIGEEKTNVLNQKCVAIFGLGGVGSFAFEALVRAGICKIIVCDGDKINASNKNRQLFALNSTIGNFKTDEAEKRAKDINENVEIVKYSFFVSEENISSIDFSGVDYIIDCIDQVTNKVLLAKTAKKRGVKIISCLGTGNKLDATKFLVEDIFKTSVCPLAKVMRNLLRKENIQSLKVVYSKEEPIKTLGENKREVASISFVPPVAGMIIAGEVIKDLIS